jgi:pyridoxamine 5'-phosphate oxidase
MSDPAPVRQFERWFAEAVATGMKLPEAMALATATRRGVPSARMVLFRGVSRGGFVFFTNYQSRKGREITQNPHAALLFHWPALERQVRIDGSVRKLARRASADYFRSRPRESQLAAWASAQSAIIPSRESLEAAFERAGRRFEGQDVPCPPFWGGFRLVPSEIEFWQGRAHRLHDRCRYVKQRRGWKAMLLAP